MTGYKRVLLKLSGQALYGETPEKIIDPAVLEFLVQEIKPLFQDGHEVVIVLGAGNIWRGARSGLQHIDRVQSDHMGMLGTVINSLALQAAFEHAGLASRVLSALAIPEACEQFNKRRAVHHLRAGRVVICGGGIGNPFFSTDSAAALRALELECEIVLKATNVEAVYDADPQTNPQAKKYTELSFEKALEQNLHVMDGSAIALCRDNQLPIRVFRLQTTGNIAKAVKGEPIGTVVH